MKKGMDDWETPQWLFNLLNSYYEFTLDAAANEDNYKVNKFLLKDSLDLNWNHFAGDGAIWLNPPYNRKVIRSFMEKAYKTAEKGNTVVCLVAARTDTMWFHEYAKKATEIIFLEGRLREEKTKNHAPFPSVIIVFDTYKQPGDPVFAFWNRKFLARMQRKYK